MVTRRARRWIQRGIAIAITAAVLGLGLAAWFTSAAIEDDLLFVTSPAAERDPSTIGLAFEQVDVPGPLGNYPAWLVSGAPGEDTWAIFVHDRTANRSQALDLLPAMTEHGLTSLVITYRNDVAAPPSEGRHHALGVHEWEDLEAAVRFALTRGARDVVLVGHGSGGGIALTFLRTSDLSRRAAGVILDSPYLDPGTMVDRRIAEDNVPGFLAGWGKALTTFRFGIDWSLLDQVEAAGEFTTPMLLVQGTADRRAPAHLADALVRARPDLVRYVLVSGAGHLEPFAVDGARYLGAVGSFLRRYAVGASGLPEPEQDGGVE